MWQNYTLITAGVGGGCSLQALALQHSGRYWAGGRFSSFCLAFCGKIVRDVAGVTQSPVYLCTHCHFNEVIVNSLSGKLSANSSRSVAWMSPSTLPLIMATELLPHRYTRPHNPQDGVLGFSGYNRVAFYVQIASEGDVSWLRSGEMLWST